MKRMHITILLLITATVAAVASEPVKNTPASFATLCVRWLLDGEIEHRWSDKGARDWNHNGVFRLRAYINKHYTNAIPVVVGQGNANQTWFSFDKTHSNLVAAATGTNTVSSPALQIIEGPINGSTQEMRIVYSMNMIRLDVVSDEGREPRLVLTEYRLSD